MDVDTRTVRDTSIEAMRSVEPRAPNLRTRCLNVLRQYGAMTADEVADRLGETVLSVRPQFTLLTKENKIVDSGKRRLNSSGRNAIVWLPTHPSLWREADASYNRAADQERDAIIAFMRGAGSALKRSETIEAIQRGDHLK